MKDLIKKLFCKKENSIAYEETSVKGLSPGDIFIDSIKGWKSAFIVLNAQPDKRFIKTICLDNGIEFIFELGTVKKIPDKDKWNVIFRWSGYR